MLHILTYILRIIAQGFFVCISRIVKTNRILKKKPPAHCIQINIIFLMINQKIRRKKICLIILTKYSKPI